jgi:hypothetical protein
VPIIEKHLWTSAVTEPTINFDTLCISAQFQTLMGEYAMRDGNYGIRVDLTTNQGNIYHLILDSKKDMFGDPYAYTVYLAQEQTYHLSLEENIIQVDGYLYQLNNFTYDDGVSPEFVRLDDFLYDNIYVKDI